MAGLQDSFPTRMRIELKSLGDLRKEYRSKGNGRNFAFPGSRRYRSLAYACWAALSPLALAAVLAARWSLGTRHEGWLPAIVFSALALGTLLHFSARKCHRRYRESTPGHFVRGQARKYWLMAHAYLLQGLSLFLAAAYLAAFHVSAFGWAGFAFSGPFLAFSFWILYRRFVLRLYRDCLKAAILQRSGSEGEAEVARMLIPAPKGWNIRFGVELASIGDIDIVAEGPGKTAVLIEVKSHRGRISLSREEGRERLLRDGEDLEPNKDILAQVSRQLRALEKTRRYRKCRAVICFSRGRLESGFPDYLGSIQVTEARDLRLCLFGASERASQKSPSAVS